MNNLNSRVSFKNRLENVKKIIDIVFKHWAQRQISVYSAYFSYYMLISFFPFMIILIIIISYTPLVNLNELKGIYDYFPNTSKIYIENIISDILDINRNSILSISIIGVIWTSSKAFSALIKVLNNAYLVVETRNYFLKKIHCIILSLLLSGMFVFYIVLVIMGDLISELIVDKIGMIDLYLRLKNIVRFGLPILMIFIFAVYIYYFVPNRKLRFKEILPGCIFLTIGFIAVTKFFRLNISLFSNYNRIYGGVAGIVILLLWINILSTLIMIGAEINGTLKFYIKENKIDSLIKRKIIKRKIIKRKLKKKK